MNSIGKDAYVLPELFAAGRSIFVPYIFMDEELSSLFQEIDLYRYPRDPFRPLLFSVYFRLTYTCGLRPNESRNLKRQDVYLDPGEIQILNTKKQKSRTVVMSDDMCSMMRTYITLRDTMRPDSEHLFPTPEGRTYTAAFLQKHFKRFFALANPHIPHEFLPPVRVYDLRHHFATAVLNR